MQALAGLLDHDVDAHRLLQVDAVVVDEALRLEAAVGPFGHRGVDRRLRYRQQAPESGENLLPAELADEFGEPLLAQPVGAKLSADVAEHELRRAAVGAD